MDHPNTEEFRMATSRWRRWMLIGGGVIGGLLLSAYLVVGYIAADRFSAITRHAQKDSPATYGIDFEAVQFTPRDDPALTLQGWLLPQAEATQTIILVHGFGLGGCRSCDFKERFTEFAAQLHANGFAVLLFDLRGHGESDAARYTFGVREQRDVLGAVDFLLARGVAPGQIGVLGASMGGASSIIATASEPAIGALITDSAFADLDYLLQREFPRRSGLPAWLLPSVYLMGQAVTGENVSNARPEQVIAQIAPRPVLIIHGDADELVPVEHSARLAAAAPHADVWIVPGATHVESWVLLQDAYVARVADFFRAHLR
jgi:pimeloyl-ACP methyl ester carboxylesterase